MMKKLTNLLVSLLALFGTVISASADVISPGELVVHTVANNIWAIVLVIVVIILAVALLRIFRKKTVSGMNSLCADKYCCADYLIFVEIAFRCFGTADAVALIRKGNVQGVFIRFGINRNGRHSHFLAGSDYSNRDLSTVRDQYF